MEVYNNTLTETFVSIKFDDGYIKAYVNSARGRNDLASECSTDIVQTVFQIWGDNPTVIDPVLSFEPEIVVSDLDIVGKQLVETLLQSG